MRSTMQLILCLQITITNALLQPSFHRSFISSLYTNPSSIPSTLAAPLPSELDKALSTLSDPQKYELLIQSYGNSLLESNSRKDTSLEAMQSLYREMLLQSQVPSTRATGMLLNAAASFCSPSTLSDSLRLCISGGALRTFGVGVGRLTTPAVSSVAAAFLEPVPSDDREKEVLYAALLGTLVSVWGVLEIASFFSHEADQFSFTLVLSSAAIMAADVYFRAGKELRMAAAGLERLTLGDKERDSHCESAAFITGYLMGLPCYCFRPDVVEALRMLRDNPSSLDSYKQPLARKTSSIPTISRSFFDAFTGKQQPTNTSVFTIPALPSSVAPETDVFALGRVLVWLMAPVAAEKLKYGRSISSDPRRSRRLLVALDGLRNEAITKLATGGLNDDEQKAAETLANIPVPSNPDDREALLRWAFFEASSLIRQYADLLDDVRSFLQTGSTTVGECVFLVEDELL